MEPLCTNVDPGGIELKKGICAYTLVVRFCPVAGADDLYDVAEKDGKCFHLLTAI